MTHRDLMNPAIVVVAYNREQSLRRLLHSVLKAEYPPGADVHLVISIDHGDNPLVVQAAEEFEWSHGPKRIIAHEVNLGLRKHVLSCGDLALEYGSIIMLEDDLMVSPIFYSYAREALSFYNEESRVAGVSLYAHGYNQFERYPFSPVEDGYDAYFRQFPASWGQAWTACQWRSFREWYDQGHQLTEGCGLPSEVVRWPESSWLKYFALYLVEKKLFFVYPKIGLSTNMSDAGAHHVGNETAFQISLRLKKRSAWEWPLYSDEALVYDSFYELTPVALSHRCPWLSSDSITVDLYGSKDLAQVKTEYLLSSRICRHPARSFPRLMWPQEMNVIQGLPGDQIFFGKVVDFRERSLLERSAGHFFFLRTVFSKQIAVRFMEMIFAWLFRKIKKWKITI